MRKETKWEWSSEHDKAFKDAKDLVSTAPILAHYDVTKQIKLYCDASPRGVGTCLMQVVNGQEKPVAYASRTLTPAEVNYAQIEREALAIILLCASFTSICMGDSLS